MKLALLNAAAAALGVAALFSDWEEVAQRNPMNPSYSAYSFYGKYSLYSLTECQTSNNVVATYTADNVAADCKTTLFGAYPAPTPYEKTYKTFNSVSLAFTVLGAAVSLLTGLKGVSAMIKGAAGAAPCPKALASSNAKMSALAAVFWILSWAPFLRIKAEDEAHYPGAKVNLLGGFALSVITFGLSLLLAFGWKRAAKTACATPAPCCSGTVAGVACWFSWATMLAVSTLAIVVASTVSVWETIVGVNAVGPTYNSWWTLWSGKECDYMNWLTGMMASPMGTVYLDCQTTPINDYALTSAADAQFRDFNAVVAAFMIVTCVTSAAAAWYLVSAAFKSAAGNSASVSCASVKGLYASLASVAALLVAWPVFTRITLEIDQKQQTEALGRVWNYGPGFVLAIIATISSLLTAFTSARVAGAVNASAPALLIKLVGLKAPATDAAELAKDCAAAKKSSSAVRALLLSAVTMTLAVAALFGHWELITVTGAGGKEFFSGIYSMTTFTECNVQNWAGVPAGAEGLDCYSVMSNKWGGWETAPSGQKPAEAAAVSFMVIGAFTALIGFLSVVMAFASGKAGSAAAFKLNFLTSAAGAVFFIIAWAIYIRVFNYDVEVLASLAAPYGAGAVADVVYGEGFALCILASVFSIVSAVNFIKDTKVVLAASPEAAAAPALPTTTTVKAVEMSAAAPAAESAEATTA